MKKTALFTLLALLLVCAPGFASENPEEFVLHHLVNNRVAWHPIPGVSIPLLQGVSIRGADMGVTLHAAMLMIAGLFLLVIFGLLYRKRSGEAPRGLTNMLEAVVLFVRDEICVSFLGEKDGRRLAPLFLTFFFFILTVNLMGLVPVFATATANVNVTASLSLVTLGLMVIGGFIKNGPIGFIRLFLPPGVPLPLYVIVFPLEVMGLFTRPLALTLRLFANMLAGHLVILTFLSLIMKFGWGGVPFVLMAFFIYMLEVLVALLQAFIFTMLSAIFAGSMMHPSH
jgi:F-type H+-transporting ATPase subunit a